MAVINTGLLTKGLRSEFFDRFDKTPTHYQDLATRIPSTSDAETYKWLGTVPRMREWGTGRLAKGLRTESYSVENLKYETTIEVDRDEIADDRTGQIRIRVGELAQRAATHKDYLLAQLLINGATAGHNSYDGVTFFSNAHVSGSSGSQSNDLTCAAAATDNTPTTEEFKTALKQAIAQMLTFKDDQGEPLPLNMGGLVCVVPPTMLFTAMEAVNASVINQTSNVMAGVARVIALPWLTTATTWYLL
ncbi:MAG TPA: Mu-like prophage major head subunit gpT family protein, partial [Phycisphaerae bacterium]|nr:Mu-like prophage major head subunit gpT family protein [Phycisphaerae bacterium]